MKKISPKRIIIGVVVGGGLVFGLWTWLMSDAFPALWITDEDECLEETFKQPFVSQDYYLAYFRDCMIEKGVEYDDTIYISPEDIEALEVTG